MEMPMKMRKMKNGLKGAVTVFLILCINAPFFAAEKRNSAVQLQTYNTKTVYFQKGFLFVPDRIVLNGNAYTVGGQEMYRILTTYPSSAGEIEKFRTTSVLGAGLLAGGVALFFGGLLTPRFLNADQQTVNIVAASFLLAGVLTGGAGVWLMNSDIKQNFLYRSIWYYNEAVLFEDPNNLQSRNETRFEFASFVKEF